MASRPSSQRSRAAAPRRSRSRAAAPPALGLERRTLIVFACLLFGMSTTYGVLHLLEPGAAPLRGVTLMSIERSATVRPEDKLFDHADPIASTPQASEPWAVIVIHDSQRLTGSYDSIDAAHREAGKAGCGYHFVINNGSTEQDGRIELGYRWNYQEPGDFFEGPEAEAFNRRFRTIGICLIGDLDRQAPTGAQLRELDWLVRSLQAQYGIPTDRVFLDLGSDGDGIGAHFPHVAFRRGLEAGARLAQR